MDMPTPCPTCKEIVDFNDMVNHPNEFKTMVCEDCHDRIEDENNRGEQTDAFNNKLEWIANPDDGLIDFKVNGDPITTWSYEDDPELSFHGFLSIWNKAQESIALAQAAHADDLAIDRFAAAMKAKMAAARAKGRSGWDDPERCSGEMLAAELVSHLSKNNPGTFEDVANFAMMLHQRNESPSLLLDEVNGLKEQVEELKAMFVDALGDGFYDGYLKCKKDFEEQRDNEPWYISKVGDNDVIAMSEDYESNHRYSKSINDIKIKAICDFKDELTKSVSVMFKPHIEGVCAVVIEKLSAAKDGE